jgi:hypothetical protein
VGGEEAAVVATDAFLAVQVLDPNHLGLANLVVNRNDLDQPTLALRAVALVERDGVDTEGSLERDLLDVEYRRSHSLLLELDLSLEEAAAYYLSVGQ